jgi:hypothetical protein
MALNKLPLGIEYFEKIRTQGFCYIDKTGLIIELLNHGNKVNLFTRPRRFGKSLNLNTLQTFLEMGCKKELFDGLAVAQDKALCEKYMGQFPVISITLKGVDGRTYSEAKNALKYILGNEALRLLFLKQSENLSSEEKEKYQALIRYENGSFTMSDDVLVLSLKMLSELLTKHYGQKTIMLIDEYDAPLDRAFQAGYYEEMVTLVCDLFGNVLKMNQNLQFAVLVGCLNVPKESVFAGLNDLETFSITNVRYDKYFGFTEDEVKLLLEYYGLQEHYASIQEWYNGYKFGNTTVYCPWDILNYCNDLRADPHSTPQNYWVNTSGNALVRRFLEKANEQMKEEMERLLAGESIIKEISQELTYEALEEGTDNIWSALFVTGYLTYREQVDENKYRLAIPNREIRSLFVKQIKIWFASMIQKNIPKLDAFCDAFPAGDAATIERLLNDYLRDTISLIDAVASVEYKESFYREMLLVLLRRKENWLSLSNVVSGEGYRDILVEVPEGRIGVVIALKYAETDALEAGCAKALSQIDEKQCHARLLDDGMKAAVKYGIAFYQKRCKVVRAAADPEMK